MPPRDADRTRQRLIEAASAEFAEHGIAGARVDRIAANAQANKAQIYHYFGSKDRLFDAVWEALTIRLVDGVPLDAGDLPEYAARLSQAYADNPELARLITWQRLERGQDPPNAYAMQSLRGNFDAIAKAQADGLVSDRFKPDVLFALILHIAALWAFHTPDVLAIVNLTDAHQRREIVKSSVAALLG
jgi:AcrR family transcriptional regulator